MENINNEQELTNQIRPTNNRKKIFSAILAIVLIIAILFVSVFIIYKTTIDISNKKVEQFDYNLSTNNYNNYNYLSFIKYNSNEDLNHLSITIPKDYVYSNLLKINEFSDNISSKYDIKINKIGIFSNIINKNYLDFYADVNYKSFINAYISGNIKYEINNKNGIDFVLSNIVVGDGLPSIFYKYLLPIKNGDIIFDIDSNNFEFLNDNVLNLQFIDNISLNKEHLKFKYDYMSNLKDISKYIFGEKSKYIDNSLENIMPIILEIMVGDNKEEYSEIASAIIPQFLSEIIDIKQ